MVSSSLHKVVVATITAYFIARSSLSFTCFVCFLFRICGKKSTNTESDRVDLLPSKTIANVGLLNLLKIRPSLSKRGKHTQKRFQRQWLTYTNNRRCRLLAENSVLINLLIKIPLASSWDTREVRLATRQWTKHTHARWPSHRLSASRSLDVTFETAYQSADS